MERYRLINDKTHEILLETDFESRMNIFDEAYKIIKGHPDYDVFLEVYTEEGFSHWVDSETIISEVEMK